MHMVLGLGSENVNFQEIRGTELLDLIFEDFVYFLKKIKQLWTKYLMDLIRNVLRNSEITVLFQ